MVEDTCVRVAMWSGPRNISTALLRSFGNRRDTIVSDEPLYASYLAITGKDHPAAAEVMAAGETNWRAVARTLTGPAPAGRAIWYQKHMAHHLLPAMERDWLLRLRHAFLIRDPKDMLTSLVRVLPEPELEDTGLPQQVELFDTMRSRQGSAPPVIDSRDVLQDPERLLRSLCERLAIPFDADMLHWPPGPRDTDGVWAPHWYGSVLESTGFAPFRAKSDVLPPALEGVHARCRELYEHLHAHCLS